MTSNHLTTATTGRSNPSAGRGDAPATNPASTASISVDDAYERCKQITAAEARNFSYGIRLLPRSKREAMCALYAMARRIDDIGDGEADSDAKLGELAEVRSSLVDLQLDTSSAGTDPVLVALGDVARRYRIPMDALQELIDGCEMDVRGVSYDTFEDLVGYCQRVAGTVGRLSVAVYGHDAGIHGSAARVEHLADSLGVALQITNILRDIVEDRETMGRVYLPAEDRARFGVDDDLRGPENRLADLIRFEAERARGWYSEGLQLLPLLDWRSRACTAAMAGIYRRLLDRIEADPMSVTRGRVSLSSASKARVAARALIRGEA